MNLDSSQVVASLLNHIGQLGQEIAMLKVQLEAAIKPENQAADTEVENGSDTV